jgi:hypothetical protein
MYVRINTIYCDKANIDTAVDYIEDSDRSVVEAAAGNRGLATLVDRDAGLVVAASYWDEPAHSSAAVLTKAREGAVLAANGSLTTESYEIVAGAHAPVIAAGVVARMARMRIEPARSAEVINFLEEEILPELAQYPGLCDAQILLNRDSGDCIVATVWRDDAAVEAVGPALARLDRRPGEHPGGKLLRVETYTMIRTSMRRS